MTEQDFDLRVRLAAFAFLDELSAGFPDGIPFDRLRRGFAFEGRQVPLVSPQGIFKPALLPDMPLAIRTTAESPGRDRPYPDEIDPGSGLIAYSYRGTDPDHPDNVGLRKALARRAPLVYLFGLVPGLYAPVYPVYVVGDEPANLTFTVAADEALPGDAREGNTEYDVNVRRLYVTRVVKQRLHQVAFRQQVIVAYGTRCAICRLRHAELLDAAHILPDGHPRGLPIVPNGLALCRLHHAAFDAHIVGVRPDLRIDIRRDVLDEIDGPMLVHGLQGFHRERLHVPRAASLRPRPEFLEERYEIFRAAG